MRYTFKRIKVYFVYFRKQSANVGTKMNEYPCRKEYVEAYVNYVFNVSVEKQFDKFRRGFLRGCPTEKWKIFLPVELQLILHGHTEYNWEQLEQVLRTSDRASYSDPH